MEIRRWADDAREGLTAGLPAKRFDGPLASRPATAVEATGRRTLNKAVATVVVGGLIIAATSAIFSTSLFAADIRMAGLFIGLAIMGLGLTSLVDPGGRKLTQGVFIIALGVVAMPIALGGYIIGSLAAIIGGAMLVGYEPPEGQLAVQAEVASYPRRLLALLADFVVALVAQRILYFLADWFFVNTFNVALSWALVWFVVVIEPSVLTRRTAGRLLVSTRVAGIKTAERATTLGTIIRETLRGAIAIGALFMIAGATLQSSFQLFQGILMTIVVIGLVALFEGFGLLDRLSGTTAVHERLVPAPPGPAGGVGGADGGDTNPKENGSGVNAESAATTP